MAKTPKKPTKRPQTQSWDENVEDVDENVPPPYDAPPQQGRREPAYQAPPIQPMHEPEKDRGRKPSYILYDEIAMSDAPLDDGTGDTHRSIWATYRVQIVQKQPLPMSSAAAHGIAFESIAGAVVPTYDKLLDHIKKHHWTGEESEYAYTVRNHSTNRFVTQGRVVIPADPIRIAKERHDIAMRVAQIGDRPRSYDRDHDRPRDGRLRDDRAQPHYMHRIAELEARLEDATRRIEALEAERRAARVPSMPDVFRTTRPGFMETPHWRFPLDANGKPMPGFTDGQKYNNDHIIEMLEGIFEARKKPG